MRRGVDGWCVAGGSDRSRAGQVTEGPVIISPAGSPTVSACRGDAEKKRGEPSRERSTPW